MTVEERLRELESCIVVINELHSLSDAIYDVRERELQGWKGPKVKAYGEALNKLQELLKEGGVTL